MDLEGIMLGEILHNPTYTWNLKNKMNKQTKAISK